MRNSNTLGRLSLLVAFGGLAGTAGAQQQQGELAQTAVIQHIRPLNESGRLLFESPKADTLTFKGLAFTFGAAFAQQFQGLQHTNTAAANMVNGVNTNQLITIGHGFNNAVANLYLNAQLAQGIRVQMTSYLSARHHQESWVKDGYILIDASPVKNATLENVMKYVTARVGHFEINYGDAHYRRTDNGNGMYNAFVGNYILDAFTTEIGAEVYARADGLLAMLAATSGEVHGQVTAPGKHTMSTIGKLGFDEKFADNVRVRLTGSFYANNKGASNTLFTGDRAGSRYYDVLENTASTESANAWSGAIRPGFSNKVNAFVVNPFIKVGGVELFGNFETATGGSFAEPQMRTVRQNVYEGVYRFADEHMYLGARYNTLQGEMISKSTVNATVNRYQLAGGWFVTPNLLSKIEWVNQKYLDFPTTDIRNGGNFKGFMIEGVVAF
jgi:hypothetical protein